MLSELEAKEKRLIRQAVWEADTTLKTEFTCCLSSVHKIKTALLIPVSNFITLLEMPQLHRTHCTQHLHVCLPFSLLAVSAARSAALERWHACSEMQDFSVTSQNLISPQHSLTDLTFCSNALKCIRIVAARCCLFLCSVSLTSSLRRSLSPFFLNAFFSLSFSFHPFDSPSLLFLPPSLSC